MIIGASFGKTENLSFIIKKDKKGDLQSKSKETKRKKQSSVNQ